MVKDMIENHFALLYKYFFACTYALLHVSFFSPLSVSFAYLYLPFDEFGYLLSHLLLLFDDCFLLFHTHTTVFAYKQSVQLHSGLSSSKHKSKESYMHTGTRRSKFRGIIVCLSPTSSDHLFLFRPSQPVKDLHTHMDPNLLS